MTRHGFYTGQIKNEAIPIDIKYSFIFLWCKYEYLVNQNFIFRRMLMQIYVRKFYVQEACDSDPLNQPYNIASVYLYCIKVPNVV